MISKKRHREQAIRRFSTGRILEHWIAILTFGILVVTGCSQKFFSLDVSQWLILKLGGIDTVRVIHRYTGVLFMLSMLVHSIVACVGISLRRWQPSMVIIKKDVLDAIHNIKYYLGMENATALCDRYDYKQKFEYWGILTGGILMIITGLVLWFPVSVTKFLPGQIIPAAKALHSNEALVIVLLIAVWHIYNSIFSPDVFPLDTSIFSGYISRERMINEHPLELARREGISVEEIRAERDDDLEGFMQQRELPEP